MHGSLRGYEKLSNDCLSKKSGCALFLIVSTKEGSLGNTESIFQGSQIKPGSTIVLIRLSFLKRL